MLIASPGYASDAYEGEVKDAWIAGKIETIYTLNRNLNPFDIDTSVENGVVMLEGIVENDIERDLAVELAKEVDGVTEVKNGLSIQAGTRAQRESAANTRRDFGTWVDDATTTAAVKSRLVSNSNVKGLQIDVDTNNDIVTLSGRVSTDTQKQLAEQLAQNVRDVHEVKNNLVVDPQ